MMLEGYSDRMVSRERLTRVAKDGSRMIVDRWFEPRPEGPQARPGARRGVSAANNSPEDKGADASLQDK